MDAAATGGLMYLDGYGVSLNFPNCIGLSEATCAVATTDLGRGPPEIPSLSLPSLSPGGVRHHETRTRRQRCGPGSSRVDGDLPC